MGKKSLLKSRVSHTGPPSGSDQLLPPKLSLESRCFIAAEFNAKCLSLDDNDTSFDPTQSMQNVDRFGKKLQLAVLVKDCLRRGSSIEQVSAALTERVKQHCPKWNWTVLCGQDFEVCRHADNWHEVMFCQDFEENLKVIIIRGSPLDKYEGGPANLAIVREALPTPARDLRAIKRAVEISEGSCDRIVANIKKYFSEKYPSENVVVIAGEDFALSQQFDELTSLIFCAVVGQISILIVLADNRNTQ